LDNIKESTMGCVCNPTRATANNYEIVIKKPVQTLSFRRKKQLSEKNVPERCG
jgi:hypothetical protein